MHLGHVQVDLHYNGFCNSVLWQLFHYVPLNMDSKLSETRTLQVQWSSKPAPSEHCNTTWIRCPSSVLKCCCQCQDGRAQLVDGSNHKYTLSAAVSMGSAPVRQSALCGCGAAQLLCWGCCVGPGLPPHAAASHAQEPGTKDEGSPWKASCQQSQSLQTQGDKRALDRSEQHAC